MERNEQKLDRLLAFYRDSSPDIDASGDFESKVWRGIAASRDERWLARRFDRLLAFYRDATPEFEESPEFVPLVWQRIEASREVNWLSPLRVWSTRLALSAAVAAGLLIGAVALELPQNQADFDDTSYVDALTHNSLAGQEDALWVMAASR